MTNSFFLKKANSVGKNKNLIDIHILPHSEDLSERGRWLHGNGADDPRKDFILSNIINIFILLNNYLNF